MNQIEWFHSIEYSNLVRMVETKERETLHLDFKVVGDSLMDKNDRKNYAKALSGFANSDSGVVIWGISTKQDDKTDAASEFVPISDVSQFYSRLLALESQLVNPTVEGIEHKVIRNEIVDDSSGYVCTYIPSSNSGPHMAKGKDQDRYYFRTGDSFKRMEHFQVSDMFGRRPRPELTLDFKIDWRGYRGAKEPEFSIDIYINNKGAGLAIAPYLALHANHPYSVANPKSVHRTVDPTLRFLVSNLGHGWSAYGSSNTFVIHQNTSIWGGRIHGTLRQPSAENESCIIQYKLAAQSFALVSGYKKFSCDEIISSLDVIHE